MKTKLFLRSALLLMFSTCLIVFSAFSIIAKTPKKVLEKKHHIQIEYYFKFYDGLGDECVMIGRGGTASGSVNTFYEACINGTLYDSGTCTGTYSYNSTTEVMTLTNVTMTTSGKSKPFATFSGEPTEYNTSVISITDCGTGGSQ